jgi:hypothetical protein
MWGTYLRGIGNCCSNGWRSVVGNGRVEGKGIFNRRRMVGRVDGREKGLGAEAFMLYGGCLIHFSLRHRTRPAGHSIVVALEQVLQRALGRWKR